MLSDFIQWRLGLHFQSGLEDGEGHATPTLVSWIEYEGGTDDPVTGANVSGVRQICSGMLNCFGVIEPARSVVRQHAEIQTGDLILSVGPEAEVAVLAPGSGTRALLDLRERGVRVQWGDEWYAPAECGEQLAVNWDVIIEGTRVYRKLLFRRAT